MKRIAPAVLGFSLAVTGAAPATADVRLYAYDASDRITQTLTRGITLEVERGLFGAISVRSLISTTQRGTAHVTPGGPDAVRTVLPEGAAETAIYAIVTEGESAGLIRALCPGAEAAWLVVGRVRVVRPLTMQAVGRWADGRYRHCVTLSYSYRGEWAAPPARAPEDNAPIGR